MTGAKASGYQVYWGLLGGVAEAEASKEVPKYCAKDTLGGHLEPKWYGSREFWGGLCLLHIGVTARALVSIYKGCPSVSPAGAHTRLVRARNWERVSRPALAPGYSCHPYYQGERRR